MDTPISASGLSIGTATIGVQLDLSKYNEQLRSLGAGGTLSKSMGNIGSVAGGAVAGTIAGSLIANINQNAPAIRGAFKKAIFVPEKFTMANFFDSPEGQKHGANIGKAYLDQADKSKMGPKMDAEVAHAVTELEAMEKAFNKAEKSREKKHNAEQKVAEQEHEKAQKRIIANDELMLKKEDSRKKLLHDIAGITTKIAAAGAAAVGGGFIAFLKTTDTAAYRLNSSVQRVKVAFFQLMANVGKVADAKWGLTDKLEKFANFLKSISKDQISNFLDTVKLSIYVAGFAKILSMTAKMADYFAKMRAAQATMTSMQYAGVTGTVRPPPLPGTTTAGAGATFAAATLAILGMGVAFRAMTASGDTAARVSTGLATALSNIGKIFYSIIEVVGTVTDWLGGVIGTVIGNFLALGMVLKNIGTLLADIATKRWVRVARDVKNIGFADQGKNIWDAVSGKGLGAQFAANWKNIWGNKPGTTGDQDGLRRGGFIEGDGGGFAGLNAAFQKMFENNIAQGLTIKTAENTRATQDNTAAVRQLSAAVAMQQSTGSVFDNGLQLI